MNMQSSHASESDITTLDETIVKVVRGVATPLDQRRIDLWLAESGKNQQYFDDFERSWRAYALPASVPESFRTPPQADQIIRASARLDRKLVRRGFGSLALRREVLPWAIAAGVAAVSLGVVLGKALVPQPTPESVYMADPALGTTVLLDDGSAVRLGAGGVLRYSSLEAERRISLSGIAFFSVAPDSNRPFFVQTDRGTVRVTGTRFEVDATDGALRLVVVEGSVRLDVANTTVPVRAGQRAQVSGDNRVIVEDIGNPYDYLRSAAGVLLFRNSPLSDVARALKHAFSIETVIEDSLFQGRTITAAFGDEPLNEVVASICLMLSAQCDVTAERVTIGRDRSEEAR